MTVSLSDLRESVGVVGEEVWHIHAARPSVVLVAGRDASGRRQLVRSVAHHQNRGH